MPKEPPVTCAAIMRPGHHRAKETDSIRHAAEAIVRHGCIDIPVVDAADRLIGVFGIYDLLALLVPRVAVIGDLLPNLRFLGEEMDPVRAAFRGLRDEPIRRAVNRDAASVFPDTPAIEALRLFCRQQMTIPVVERETKRLLGVITYWDAAKTVIGPT